MLSSRWFSLPIAQCVTTLAASLPYAGHIVQGDYSSSSLGNNVLSFRYRACSDLAITGCLVGDSVREAPSAANFYIPHIGAVSSDPYRRSCIPLCEANLLYIVHAKHYFCHMTNRSMIQDCSWPYIRSHGAGEAAR